MAAEPVTPGSAAIRSTALVKNAAHCDASSYCEARQLQARRQQAGRSEARIHALETVETSNEEASAR